MARSTARTGRRRRVLNEEALSASQIAIHTSTRHDDFEPGDTPRYGAGANIENHPQVTSYVPRRLRTFALIGLGGFSVGCVAEVTARYAESLSTLVPVVAASEITEVFANRLVAWTAALLLLLTAAATRLIFTLRRHRVDDYRGHYRVWRSVGWVAAAVSLNCVLGAHQLVARSLGSLVNWQLLPASAGWWLGPAVLLGGWLGFKLIAEVAECRSALSLYVLSFVCLAVAGIHSAGWSPAVLADWPGLLGRALPLWGYSSMLVGSLVFARYVILDVQGLIERADDEQPTQPALAVAESTLVDSDEPQSYESDYDQDDEEDSDWVDGTEPEYYQDDAHDGRKLSKADRKRLRKQKQRDRAA